MNTKQYLLLGLLLVSTTLAWAQKQQTIRGQVKDLDSGYPLVGVTVIILDTDPVMGATTDIDGNYVITGVPVGRISLRYSFIGYREVILNDQLLEVGKELFLNVSLEEEVTSMGEIVVTAEREPDILNNDAAVVATRAFDVQETRRYAGSRNDVARMAANYAGVANADDARNDIVIRGNSPSGLLWRLEGIDIPSPNHFNAFGTTGGPVGILNNNNLANSDFFTSAFPADYGNTVSGVFDLQLRKGNGFKGEYMGQIGFNGFELGAEGPLSKKTHASYVANYRYSTLGVFKALGVDFGTGTAVPEYQDLTFAVDIPSKKIGSLKLFGMGGLSNIHFAATTERDEQGSLYTTADLKNNARIGVIGLKHLYFFNPRTNLTTTVAASQQYTNVVIDSVQNNPPDRQVDDVRTNQTLNKFSLHTRLSTKLSAQHKITFGVMVDNLQGDFQDSLLTAAGTWFKFSDARTNTWLTQVYALYQWKITAQLKLVTGLHYTDLALNQSRVLEPRVGLSFTTHGKATLSAGYGLHSQMQPINAYTVRFRDEPTESNRGLGFTRSHHFTAEYNKSLTPGLSLKVAGYYQRIFAAPVEATPSSYSLLNMGISFGDVPRPNLVNNGRGENYGVELTLEKYFANTYYFLFTSSIFESRYQGSDEVWRNTAFNNKYIVNLLAGKEFSLGKSGVLFADVKLTTSGGRYTTPIDLEASRLAGEAVYLEDQAFSQRYANYFRTDFKIGFRLEMKRISQEWLIDVQNIFNVENIYEEFYNPQTGNIDNRNQLGLLIIPQYRILF